MLPLSRQLTVSIDFSPLTKIHQAAVLAHRFCFSTVLGRGTNTGGGIGSNQGSWGTL